MPKSTKHVKHLIIGGGLSGLSAAYFLKSDYLILEKESEVGGYCRTIHQDGFVWDYAGHFYHFKTQFFKDLFLSLVEPDQIIEQEKNSKIYYKDKLINYPFQMNIHELEQAEFIECLVDLYFKTEKAQYTDFLDMLYGKFGRSTVEKFLRPYNQKLYATDLHKLDTDAMGRFFPYANFDEIMQNMKQNNLQASGQTDNQAIRQAGEQVNGQATSQPNKQTHKPSYNDKFLYLKQGTAYFIEKLFEQLQADMVQLNTSVVEVNTIDKYVLTNAGEQIYYDNLINTSPLNRFLATVDITQSNQVINEMSCNQVLVFNLGFDAPSARYTAEHWLYFPDPKLNFYRVGFYNHILRQTNLSIYVEIGLASNAKVDIEQELQETLRNLEAVGVIDAKTKLIAKSVIMMNPAYVHIAGDTEKELVKIVSELNTHNIYTLGRYGRWTYSSMEDCMQWAKELAGQLGSDPNSV